MNDNVHQFTPRKPQQNGINHKHILVLIVLIALGYIVYTLERQTTTGIYVEGLNQFRTTKSLSAINFTHINGEQVSLDDFKGNVVLLHFWATWCPPCIDELPELNALTRSMQNEPFTILPISIDTNKTAMELIDFIFQHNSHQLKPYLDPTMKAYNTTLNAMNTRGLPYTVIIDKQGRAVGDVVGALLWNRPEVIDYLRVYLEKEATIQ